MLTHSAVTALVPPPVEQHKAIFGEGEVPFPILRPGGFDVLGFAAAKGPGLAGGLYDVNNPAKILYFINK